MERVWAYSTVFKCEKWKILRNTQVVGDMICGKKNKFMNSWGQNYCEEERCVTLSWVLAISISTKREVFPPLPFPHKQFITETCVLFLMSPSPHQPFSSIPIVLT